MANTTVTYGAPPQTKPGAAVLFQVSGITVGYASGLNITEDDSVVDVDVLGQIYTVEFPYVGHKVHFSVNVFKIDSQTAESLGFRPAGATPSINGLLQQGPFSGQVVDTSGNVLYSFYNVVFTGGSGTIEARDIWKGTWNFRAEIGGGSGTSGGI